MVDMGHLLLLCALSLVSMGLRVLPVGDRGHYSHNCTRYSHSRPPLGFLLQSHGKLEAN